MPVEPIVATEPLPLLHTPPLVASLSVVVDPVQTLMVPVIADTVGNGLTVTDEVTVVTQPKPLVTVYDIVAVPADTPLTMPVKPIVATEPSPLLHTPPLVASLSVVVEPAHTLMVPVIADTVGNGLTVTTEVTVVTQPKPLVAV